MAQITIKVPNAALTEVADLLWQGGRPTAPPIPPSKDPVVLTDEECIKRWLVREIKTRLHQWRKEKAAKSASDGVQEPVGVE